MASVTQKKAQPFRKRPGEMHVSFGLVIPTFAGNDSRARRSASRRSCSMGRAFQHRRRGAVGTNNGLTAGGLFMQGNWLPIDGEVSPYIGVGIGYMGADSNGGLGLKAQVGVEALRLHRVRVLAASRRLPALLHQQQSL